MTIESLSFASLIHEIQSRVAAISIISGEVIATEVLNDQAWLGDRLARINRAAAELQRIVDTVKRLSDDSPLERQVTDLSTICARVVRMLFDCHPQLAHAEVSIQPAMEVLADPEQIEIVLSNLIGNALKFSSRQERPVVHVTTTKAAERTVVHVSDNGVGIPREEASRIFEPFARCHPTFDGSGVGLAISRHIVERHGGTIWVVSEPGHGATVSFTV